MEINRGSWHLRLVRVFELSYVPTNLCNYFWKVMGTLVICLCLILLSPLIGLVVACVLIGDWASNRKNQKQPKQPRQPRQPGLIHAWVSAKKQRVCPIITVVEDNL